MDIKLGNKDIPFIYQGNELLYPNPIKDGLVLWYDFKGMSNNDKTRDVAVDLSGNGNHGTLQNFNYTEESGYKKSGLYFDGIDDFVSIPKLKDSQTLSFFVNLNVLNTEDNYVVKFTSGNFFFRVGYNGSIQMNVQCYNGKNYSYESIKSEGIFTDIKENKYVGVVIDEDLVILYSNGEEVVRKKLQANVLPFNIENLGRWRNNYGKVNIHSFFLYDRVLTSEEILHNYKNEKERFGIE